MKKETITYQALDYSEKSRFAYAIRHYTTMTEVRTTYPHTPTISQKSFYKKAMEVHGSIVHPFTGEIFSYTLLTSYNVPIIVELYTSYHSELIPLYAGGYNWERYCGPMCGIIEDYNDDISATTLKHIRSFTGLSKAEYIHKYNEFWLDKKMFWGRL